MIQLIPVPEIWKLLIYLERRIGSGSIILLPRPFKLVLELEVYAIQNARSIHISYPNEYQVEIILTPFQLGLKEFRKLN